MKVSYDWKHDPFICKECGGLLDWLDGDNLQMGRLIDNVTLHDEEHAVYKNKVSIDTGLYWYECQKCKARHSLVDLTFINNPNIDDDFIHKYFHGWRDQEKEPYIKIFIDWEKDLSPFPNTVQGAFWDTEKGRLFMLYLGSILTEETGDKNQVLFDYVESTLNAALSENLADYPKENYEHPYVVGESSGNTSS